MARIRGLRRTLLPLCLTFASALVLWAEPVAFDLPAQNGNTSLLAFAQQSGVEVLFSSEDLEGVTTVAVQGRHEPDEALLRLLRGTGYEGRRAGGDRFIVVKARTAFGAIAGRIVDGEGRPVVGLTVLLSGERRGARTDTQGAFHLPAVRPGPQVLLIGGDGYQAIEVRDVTVVAGRVVELANQVIKPQESPTRLEAFVVRATATRTRPFSREEQLLPLRTAVGNLDLRRTEDDALPYTIYRRDELVRSGVVNLNDFLQRELLNGDASARPPEQDGSAESFMVGSPNLTLRGYDADETVILLNGRRLPETVTGDSSSPRTIKSDISFIPISLVQQVEVLPVSASAIYSGNPVGGVINIVLRPGVDADTTEVTTTYNNAFDHYDAPQSLLSLVHARSLLGGRLRLRVSAQTTATESATEQELGYRQANQGKTAEAGLGEAVYRATPNVRSADGSSLFGAGGSSVTSVAPGADGQGGLAAFAGRQGLRNFALFDPAGGLTASIDSLYFPYGRRQRREMYYTSLVFDATPWLELGVDGSWSTTVVNRGYEIIHGDLLMDAALPANPFGQLIGVSLNERATALGERYNEARMQSGSLVFGALAKLPSEWRLALDAQASRQVTRLRAVSGVDGDRWQTMINEGRYSPLRDTRVFAPPAEFYDRVVIYRGERGQFLTFGDYTTVDLAVRATNEAVRLPTGLGRVNVGGDYRKNHLNPFDDVRRHGDGTLAQEITRWGGRTIQRYSVFGELQGPVLSDRWRPRALKSLEADLAVRYIASDNAGEANVSPTLALKADFGAGWSLRGSVTTSNRLPTPSMSRQLPGVGSGVGAGGVNLVEISDPRRGGERYSVEAENLLNPTLRTESALTQTAGVVFQRGKDHRVRVSVDFVDTHKNDELVYLGAQDVLNLESLFGAWITRGAVASGSTASVGRVTRVLSGTTNIAWRHSQHLNVSGDYAWKGLAGGTLEVSGRLATALRYDRQFTPDAEVIDLLDAPDAGSTAALRYRGRLSAGWSTRVGGFGVETQYFHSRMLPATEWVSQGSDHIRPYWQLDAYVHRDLSSWIPWASKRVSVRGQFRVNNVLGTEFPDYANDESGAGVQAYGDWRGRVYALSLSTIF